MIKTEGIIFIQVLPKELFHNPFASLKQLFKFSGVVILVHF
jgi:hypothetical protein